MEIRDATNVDMEAITAIYNHYVRNSIATFEEQPQPVDALLEKYLSVRSSGLPYLVGVDNAAGKIVGYAYAAIWNPRSAYRFTVETSIYLHPEHRQRGLGKLLLTRLLERLRECGKSQALAGISILPSESSNDIPSCRLHAFFGFKQVARMFKLGWKFGEWVDVVIYQLALDDPISVEPSISQPGVSDFTEPS